MVYLALNTIIAFFSLTIIRDNNASSNYPISIKAFSVASLASIFIPARAVDRFFVIFSTFSKSLP
jgi:hypothetical protein